MLFFKRFVRVPAFSHQILSSNADSHAAIETAFTQRTLSNATPEFYGESCSNKRDKEKRSEKEVDIAREERNKETRISVILFQIKDENEGR